MEEMELTEDHKNRLRDNRVYIVEKLENIEELVEFMQERGCLSVDAAQEILAKDTLRNKTRNLLFQLPRLSEHGYCEFINALEETQGKPDLYLLLGDATERADPVKLPFLFGRAKEFAASLKQFHIRKLNKVAKTYPTRHDMERYVQLRLHKHLKETVEERKGFREPPMLENRPTGAPIEREKLFYSVENDEEAPKVVLLIGSPGSGKTAMAYNLLHSHTHGNLYNDQYHFVFFILLRDMAHFVPGKHITLKQFLLSSYGPSTEHMDRVWQYINHHQENVLLIMDGFDEYHPKGREPFTSSNDATLPSILIDNLINKNLLPDASVLITGRMHCLEKLEDDVDRVVELAGLTKLDLQELTKKQLPSALAEDLFKFITDNNAVAGLCSIPVNAISLIDYVRWKCTDGQTMPDLPNTRASLLLLLTVKLLHKHSSTLKDKPRLTTERVISAKADTLRKLCKMAYEGMVAEDGPKQIFEEEDLEQHGLTVEEVTESGLMTGHVTSVADDFGLADTLLLSFLHFTFQEELGSIHAVHNDQEKLVSLSEANDGRWDMMVLLSIGLCADLTCRPILQTLYPETDYSQLVPRLLEAAWGSPRRYLDDGELWSIVSLGESLQYELSADLMYHLVTPMNTLNMWKTTLTSAYCNSVVKFLHKVPDDRRFSVVRINSNLEGPDIHKLLSAGGYVGLSLGETFTAEKLAAVSRALNNTSSIRKLMLVGDGKDCALPAFAWEDFLLISNNSLECLSLSLGMLQAEIPKSLCTSLSSLKELHTLSFVANDLSCTDTGSPLQSLLHLTNVKHLNIDTCNLCASCMPTVVKMIHTMELKFLNIAHNSIGDKGAATLAEGLKDTECNLSSLTIAECDITATGIDALCHVIKGHRSLRRLDAGDNDLRGSTGLPTLTKSSLTELTLFRCRLSPEAVCSLLQPLANNESPITWLILSSNDLNADCFTDTMINVINENGTLQGLCLSNCGLTDNILHRMTKPLSDNKSIKLLDIGTNEALTSDTVVNLVQKTHIEHLDITDTDLGVEGWGKVSGALVQRNNLVSCRVGDSDGEAHLHQFLATMQLYPATGPLKQLTLNGNRASLAGQASTLRQALQGHMSVSFGTRSHHTFYLLSDLWCRDFETDVIAWLMGGGARLW